MNAIVEAQKAYLETQIKAAFSGIGQNGHGFSVESLRLSFSGPPSHLLDELYGAISNPPGRIRLQIGNDEVTVPVFLVDPGAADPSSECQSARCTASYLITARNHGYRCLLVLHGMDEEINQSLATAIRPLGLSPDAQDLESWMAEPLISHLLDQSLGVLVGTERPPEALACVRHALQESWEADQRFRDKRHCWSIIEKLFAAGEGGSRGLNSLLAALGLPACTDEEMGTDGHLATLGNVAGLLGSSGFGAGFEELERNADEDHEIIAALREFREHLRSIGLLDAGEFAKAPLSHYLPPLGSGASPPGWWAKLTAECWARLLSINAPSSGKLDVRVDPTIAQSPRGMPALTSGSVRLAITLAESGKDGQADVVISRAVGNSKFQQLATLAVPHDGTATWEDEAPPPHDHFLRYRVESQEHSAVTTKAIVLEKYSPGVLALARGAKSIKPFKLNRKPKNAGSGITERWEGEFVLSGTGQHTVDLFVSPSRTLSPTVTCHDLGSDNPQPLEQPVNRSDDRRFTCLIETGGEGHFDFSASESQTGKATYFRVHVNAEEAEPSEVNSHFQRLILQNRSTLSDDYAQAKVEPKRCRSADLEEFALEDVQSFRPVVLGPDFLDAWKNPAWLERPTLSLLSLPVDPRPSSDEMNPPMEFLSAREAVLRLLRTKEDGDAPGSAGMWKLFKLMRQDEFRQYVKQLADAYLRWLEADYDAAAWCDLYAIHAAQPHVKALESAPYAVLLSPLHPIRLAWQSQAQAVLQDAIDADKRCPAASMMNPACFPDCLSLPCRTGAGSTSPRQFAAMSSSSDYWGVLWSVDSMARLGRGDDDPVFGEELGISVDGLSTGFSAAQVGRSLKEVTRLLSGRTTLGINLCADTVGHTSLNEGIEDWCKSNLGPDNDSWAGSGELCLKVADQRSRSLQPEQASLASLSARTEAAVRWLDLSRSNQVSGLDLSIVAHLGTINHEFTRKGLASAIDQSALARWRVRKQVAGQGTTFIAESRVAGKPQGLDMESLAGSLLSCVDFIESRCRHLFDSYVFAPNMQLLKGAVDAAAYCAVSSSSIDPACFFGNGQGSYLWDYELPSYARRAGENSGYFLLAKQSAFMADAIRGAVTALGGTLPEGSVGDLLDEVARRGMPTLKRLTAGGATSLGEVGALIALRMLQSEFQAGQPAPGLLPVLRDGHTLSLVVPADPFSCHFDDLRKGLGTGSAERPDILVLSLRYQDGRAESLKVTPVEIKARSGQMAPAERKAALGQAKSFGNFLEKLQATGSSSGIWGFAYRGLLASLLDYGFRVYGQLPQFNQTGEWAERHSAALCSLASNDLQVIIDCRGRLVLIDSSDNSRPEDIDGDGFNESVLLSHQDALDVLLTGGPRLLEGICKITGSWDLMPAPEDGQTKVRPPADMPSPNVPGSVGKEPRDSHPQPGDESPDGEGPASACEGAAAPSGSLESSGSPKNSGASKGQAPGRAVESQPAEHRWIQFEVGRTINGFTSAPMLFSPGMTSLNHLNIGIVGDLGTGKTQLVQSLLHQIRQNPSDNRGKSPNVLIFDYKRDYSKPDFVQRTGARVVKPHKLPLNLFDATDNAGGGGPWLQRSKFFCDVLEKLYQGIGPVQRQRIKQAVKKSYDGATSLGKASPTLKEVFEAYATDNDMDSPYSIMSDLVDGEYFVESGESTVPFREFMSGIVVVDLASVGQDDKTKNMLVVIFLNLFYEHMLRIEKQPFLGTSPQTRFVDTMLLVDEADNIMKYEFEVLKKVLLQGREFGVGVLLASQYLSHFRTNHENYTEPLLTWFLHKVPNLTVKDLESIGIAGAGIETVNMVKGLRPHECLYKTAGIDSKFIRGTPFYELLSGT